MRHSSCLVILIQALEGYLDLEVLQIPFQVNQEQGIMIGNVPIIWVSKLQTQFALSKMEAEYIDLS